MPLKPATAELKTEVQNFWNAEPCGSRYLDGREDFEAHARARYELEPYIREFAGFEHAAGKRITTLEGLSADGTHPVQIAWQDVDVPQCGYCQAGQMMSASALLAKNPHPTDADIDAAMDGNICRCGTYLRIRKAIHKAAEIAAKQPTKEPAAAAHS